MDTVSLRPGKDAWRTQGSVRPGAVPAPPIAARRRISPTVSVYHNEPPVLVLVGDIVETSPDSKILWIACFFRICRKKFVLKKFISKSRDTIKPNIPELLGRAVPRPTVKVQDQGCPDVVATGGGIPCRQVDDEGPLDLAQVRVGHREGDTAGISGLGLIRHIPSTSCVCRYYECTKHRGSQELPRSHAAAATAGPLFTASRRRIT